MAARLTEKRPEKRPEKGPAADAGDATDSEDGRRARRERNRDAVVDALLALYREGNLQPSSDEIAERAGLSPRSLFRYFDDVDDLCRAAIARQQQRVLPAAVVAAEVSSPLPERVAALVEQRLRLFDAIGTVGVVSRLRAPFQPLIATELTQARSYQRNQLKQLFAPELTALGAARAATVLAALDVQCSFESLQLLRHDQALSRPKTAAVLAETLTTLLAPEDR